VICEHCHCSKSAAVVYGSVSLCAKHYGIAIAKAGLSQLGLVYDEATQTLRLPTEAERQAQAQAQIRENLAGPLAPVRSAGAAHVPVGQRPGPQQAGRVAAQGMAGVLHEKERRLLEQAGVLS
jgi:hypothetical protein